jgi:hypothetical protein
MAKVKAQIRDNRLDNFIDYLAYRDAYLGSDINVWSATNLDHQRLPANVDITEFMIYMKYRMEQWFDEIGYNGERPIFGPAFSDIILSREGDALSHTQDSPHSKIPWSVSYRIKRRLPMSKKPPFGSEKRLKYFHCGYFREDDDSIMELRMKMWEHIIEFIIAARSNVEVDMLTRFFESFLMSNISKFQEAGLETMIPFGRTDEPEPKLDDAGLHYRKTHYWVPTQEFTLRGPVMDIKQITLDTEVDEFSS